MTGRGLPGGGLVRRHEPEDIKVTLKLRTTVSPPTVSLLDREAGTAGALPDICIQIHASVKDSTHPDRPVTLSTWRTPLERSLGLDDASTSSPVWLNSALGYFRSTSNPDRYAGPPELGYRVGRRGGFARDLRKDWDFVTVPPATSGQECIIEHRLPMQKMQFWEKGADGYRNEVHPEKGEKWAIAPSEGGLGTFWWAWGDLEGDLRGKRFRNDAWYEKRMAGDDEEEGEEDQDKWIDSEGENGFGLTMVIESGAELTFV